MKMESSTQLWYIRTSASRYVEAGSFDNYKALTIML